MAGQRVLDEQSPRRCRIALPLFRHVNTTLVDWQCIGDELLAVDAHFFAGIGLRLAECRLAMGWESTVGSL